MGVLGPGREQKSRLSADPFLGLLLVWETLVWHCSLMEWDFMYYSLYVPFAFPWGP